MKLISGSIEHLASRLNMIPERSLDRHLKACKMMLELYVEGDVGLNDDSVQKYLQQYDMLFNIRHAEFVNPKLKDGEMVVRNIIDQLNEKATHSQKLSESTKINLKDATLFGNEGDLSLINNIVTGFVQDSTLSSKIINNIVENLEDEGVSIRDVLDGVDLNISSLGSIELIVSCEIGEDDIIITETLSNDFLSNPKEMEHIILRLLDNTECQSSLEAAFDKIIINKDLLDLED